MTKLVRMPGTSLTPVLLLEMLRENADEILDLVVVVKWKGEEFQVCNSAMKSVLLAAMGAYAARFAMDEFLKSE